MKVHELIAQLERTYKPDDELCVAYWDRATVETYVDDRIDDDAWSRVVSTYEDGEWGWQSWAADTFSEIVRESPWARL